MDQTPQAPQPEPQVVIPSSKNPLPLKKIILGLVLLLIPTILVLAYLNILPLNLIFSGQKAVQEVSQNPPSPTPNKPEKLVLSCPVLKEFCDKGKPLIYQDKVLGLGFTLPKGTKITAAFPGTLENGMESGDKLQVKSHPVRWLHGKDAFKDYIATYNFFADPVSSYGDDKMVKLFPQGEVIATSSTGSFPKDPPFERVNFIFSLTKGDKFGEQVEFEFK